MQMHRFRLGCASVSDAKWLCNFLNKLGQPFATQVRLGSDNSMTLDWQ
jgi:hypothetical protein